MKQVTGTRTSLKRGAGMFALGALICGGLMFGATSVTANARDSDGSRLQAGSMSLGSTVRDTLLPPRDRADWRSFKVTSRSTVSLSVTHKPASAKVALGLTDARGKSVASATSSKGTASLRQSLSPGIYYVSVSSGAKVSYSLSVN